MSVDGIDARSGFSNVGTRRLKKVGEILDNHVTTSVEVNCCPSQPPPILVLSTI